MLACRRVGSLRLYRCRRERAVGLCEEPHVAAAYLLGIGVEDIVGKQNVGDGIGLHEVAHVLGEIAVVDNVYFLERVEQVARQGIAEAVLENHQPPAIASACPHLHNSHVAAHEGAVGSAVAVLELVEERSVDGLALAHNLVIGVELIVGICGGVVNAIGNIIDEILGGSLQRDVSGIAIHASDKAPYHLARVALQRAERHLGNLGKLLCGIVCAKRCPVVVGTQEDVLAGMFPQNGIDIHGMNVRCEVSMYVVDGKPLLVRAFACLLGTVVVYGRGDNHAVYVHILPERLLVFVGRLRIGHSSVGSSSISHQRPHLVALAHDDDALVGYLRVLVGKRTVGKLAHVALAQLLVHAVGVIFLLVFCLCCRRGGGMEGHGIVGRCY